jgi:hypothetical protein
MFQPGQKHLSFIGKISKYLLSADHDQDGIDVPADLDLH